LKKLGSYLKKFISLPARDRRPLMEALFLQFFIGLFLKLLPFRYFHRLFRIPENFSKGSGEYSSHSDTASLQHPLNSHLLNHSSLKENLQTIRYSIQTANRFVPWHNQCLVQSLAARRMLNRRKVVSKFFFGVVMIDNKLTAHAWLMVDDFEVVAKNGDYTELYSF
jgi:hypothetical protein